MEAGPSRQRESACEEQRLHLLNPTFLFSKQDICSPTRQSYLRHLQRLLLLHASLETETPRSSAGQRNHHFLRHHRFAFPPFFFLLFALLFFCCVSLAGGPQCFGPMLSNQGPLLRDLSCSSLAAELKSGFKAHTYT